MPLWNSLHTGKGIPTNILLESGSSLSRSCLNTLENVVLKFSRDPLGIQRWLKWGHITGHCVCDPTFSSKTGVPLSGHPHAPAYTLSKFTTFPPVPMRGRGNGIIFNQTSVGSTGPGVRGPRHLEI